METQAIRRIEIGDDVTAKFKTQHEMLACFFTEDVKTITILSQDLVECQHYDTYAHFTRVLPASERVSGLVDGVKKLFEDGYIWTFNIGEELYMAKTVLAYVRCDQNDKHGISYNTAYVGGLVRSDWRNQIKKYSTEHKFATLSDK